MPNIYQENGYNDREHYLSCLAEEYDVSESVIYAIASILGESEDFDGLISSIEDHLDC